MSPRASWRRLDPVELGGMVTRADGRVELWKDEGREWRFRFRHRNGNILVWSEGYANRVDALESAWSLWPGSEIFEEVGS